MARTNKTTTTVRALNDRQIRALRAEALQAGDLAQTVICDLAMGEMDLDGAEDGPRLAQVVDTYPALTREECRRVAAMSQDEARAECARVISAAEAQ